MGGHLEGVKIKELLMRYANKEDVIIVDQEDEILPYPLSLFNIPLEEYIKYVRN